MALPSRLVSNAACVNTLCRCESGLKGKPIWLERGLHWVFTWRCVVVCLCCRGGGQFWLVLYDVRGVYSWICSFVWLFSCAGREVSKIGQEPPLVGQLHSLFFDVV